MTLQSRLRAFLSQRHKQHLYRQRRISEGPQQPEMVIDGKRVISFCSNDYLGLANHPEIIAALKRAAEEFGVGSGAAHLINGHSRAHHALEEELAEFTGRQRALVFSTGYMANLGVATALLKRGDRIFEDRLNHASLLDGGRLCDARLVRYRHRDSEDLGNKLAKIRSGEKLILTDGIFSMDGDIAPLPKLVKQAQRFDAWVMIDDAHGLGVMGKNGRGTLEHYNLDQAQVPILMGTLGKAFGTFGAFVAGSEALIETLIQAARTYIYTTASPPAIAEATRVSLQIAEKESWRRERLNTLICRFQRNAEQLAIPLIPSPTPIQPIVIGDAEKTVKISAELLKRGFLVTAIRPPTVPSNTSRLRLTFSAGHPEQKIDQLTEILGDLFKTA